MIKLNDTVSFVTSTGQQLVGVVDAFRGQGMADITTTDGMQLRQAVSALSPVRANPMRTNPMRTNPPRTKPKAPKEPAPPRQSEELRPDLALEYPLSFVKKIRFPKETLAAYQARDAQTLEFVNNILAATLRELLKRRTAELVLRKEEPELSPEQVALRVQTMKDAPLIAQRAKAAQLQLIDKLREPSGDRKFLAAIKALDDGLVEQLGNHERELAEIALARAARRAEEEAKEREAERAKIAEKKATLEAKIKGSKERKKRLESISPEQREAMEKGAEERRARVAARDLQEFREAYTETDAPVHADNVVRAFFSADPNVEAIVARYIAKSDKEEDKSFRKKTNFDISFAIHQLDPQKEKTTSEVMSAFLLQQQKLKKTALPKGPSDEARKLQRASVEQSEKTDIARKFREESERRQFVGMLALETDPNRAAFRVVDDPVRTSARGKALCGNVLDGKAYVIAISKQVRRVKRYLTWRDVGVTSPEQLFLPDVKYGEPLFEIRAQVKTKRGSRRGFARNKLDLDLVLNSQELQKPFGSLNLVGLSHIPGTIQLTPLERMDKDTNTRSQPLVFQDFDSEDLNPQSKAAKDLQNSSIFGKGTNRRFAHVIDFNRRTGRLGRSVMDYTLPPVSKTKRRAPDSLVAYGDVDVDDAIVIAHTDQNGVTTHYGFLMEVETAVTGEFIKNTFATNPPFSVKGKNPLFSWKREEPGQFGNLDEANPVSRFCPDREDSSMYNAFREGVSTVSNFLYRLSDLGRQIVMYDCLATSAWDESITNDPVGKIVADVALGFQPLEARSFEMAVGALKEQRDALKVSLDKAQSTEESLREDARRKAALVKHHREVNATLRAKDPQDPQLVQSDETVAKAEDELREAVAVLRLAEDETRSVRALYHSAKVLPPEVAEARRRMAEQADELESLTSDYNEYLMELDEAKSALSRYIRMIVKSGSASNPPQNLVRLRDATFNMVLMLEAKAKDAKKDVSEARARLSELHRELALLIAPKGATRAAQEYLQRIRVLFDLHKNSVGRLNGAENYLGQASRGCAFLTDRISDGRTVQARYGEDSSDFSVFSPKDPTKPDSDIKGLSAYQDLASAANLPRSAFEYLTKELGDRSAWAMDTIKAALEAVPKVAEVATNDASEVMLLKRESIGKEKVYKTWTAAPDASRAYLLKMIQAAVSPDGRPSAGTHPDRSATQCLLYVLGLLQQGRVFAEVMQALAVIFGFKQEAIDKIIGNSTVAELAFMREVRSLPVDVKHLLREQDLFEDRKSSVKIFGTPSTDEQMARARAKFRREQPAPDGQGSVSVFNSEAFAQEVRDIVSYVAAEAKRRSGLSSYRGFGDASTLAELIEFLGERLIELVKVPFATTKFNAKGVTAVCLYLNSEVGTQLRPPLTTLMRREVTLEEEPVGVYVSDLGFDENESSVRAKMSKFGPVSDVRFFDATTGKRAHAWVFYRTEPDFMSLDYDNKKSQYILENGAIIVTQGAAFEQELREVRPRGGAVVAVEDESAILSQKLKMALHAFQIVLTGSERIGRASSDQRKGAGIEVYYTYNPLLFEITRLYLPTLRSVGTTPFTGFTRTTRLASGEKVTVYPHPELSEEIDAIGSYGAFVELLRLVSVYHQRTTGQKVSNMQEMAAAWTSVGEQIQGQFEDLRPMNTPESDWKEVWLDLTTDTTGDMIAKLAKELKRRARPALESIGKIGEEGLFSADRAAGPGQAVQKKLVEEAPDDKEVSLITPNRVAETIAGVLQSIAPKAALNLSVAANQEKDNNKRLQLANQAQYWRSLSDGYKALKPTSTITPEQQELMVTLMSAFNPSEGGLLRLLFPDGAPKLEEHILQKSSLTKEMLAQLAQRLFEYRQELGRAYSLYTEAVPMNMLSDSAASATEPKDSLLQKTKQRYIMKRELLSAIEQKIQQYERSEARGRQSAHRAAEPAAPNPYRRG